MLGLMFFGLLGLWWWVVYRMTRGLLVRANERGWSTWWMWFITAFFAMLPFVDELISVVQLQRLCDSDGGFKVVVPSDQERIVRVGKEPEYRPLSGFPTGAYAVSTLFSDAATDEVVLHFVRLRIKPGAVAKLMGQKQPLLAGGECPSGPLPFDSLPPGFAKQ